MASMPMKIKSIWRSGSVTLLVPPPCLRACAEVREGWCYRRCLHIRRCLFFVVLTVLLQGIRDPAVLEALACREALALASDPQLSRIKIILGCHEVITSMAGGYLVGSTPSIRDIKLCTPVFASVNFVHEKRVLNMEAHGLARAAGYRDFCCHI